jgi:hypothetical protein
MSRCKPGTNRSMPRARRTVSRNWLRTSVATSVVGASVDVSGTITPTSAQPQTANDALNGNTIIMSGTFKFDSNDEVEPEKTFEMALTFTADVRFEGPDTDIVLDESKAEDLVLKLDVAMWFNTLPITTCIDTGDLVIVENHLEIVDSGDCSTIENDLKEAMKASGQLDKN